MLHTVEYPMSIVEKPQSYASKIFLLAQVDVFNVKEETTKDFNK